MDTRASLLVSEFTAFRAELDQSQAQRERIVKLSRDITALSKQMIFALHRVATGKPWTAVRIEVEQKLSDLTKLFAKLSSEVQGEDFWRYERSISPGLQEYLEGLTFYHYLEHRTLPTLAQCQASLVPRTDPVPSTPTSTAVTPNLSDTEPAPPPSTTPTANPTEIETDDKRPTQLRVDPAVVAPYVLVTPEDYLGGVADLTGELMRLAIASVGKNLHLSLQPPPPSPSTTARAAQEATDEGEATGGRDSFADIDRIAQLVREIKGEMDPLAPFARWLHKKLVVLDQSLAKIESASYNLKIRGAEYSDTTTNKRTTTTTTTSAVEGAPAVPMGGGVVAAAV